MVKAGCVYEKLTPRCLLKNQEIDGAYCIGAGSFGSVYQVTLNGFPCIIKRLHDILMSGRLFDEDSKRNVSCIVGCGIRTLSSSWGCAMAKH